jgi:hypothetical protein
MMTFRPGRARAARLVGIGLVCTGVVYTGAVCAVAGAARPASAECQCWRYIRTGDSGAGTTLGDVAAPGPGAAWAAGSRGSRPMLLTWTGTRWRETPLGFPGGTVLEGVAASSPRDAWVVGYDDGTPQVARWTGRRWGRVPVPKVGPSFPRAVEARTPADAWIVGSHSGFAGTRAGMWHWDGRSWSVVSLPIGVGMNSELVAVAAHAANDAWAIGGVGTMPPRQLLLHWDGTAWTAAPVPALPAEADLTDVTMVSGNNVWAVGGRSRRGRSGAATRSTRTVQPPSRPSRPLAEHWDGKTWRVMPAPRIDGQFYSVAGDGGSGVWAAGQRADGSALLAHWDGRDWDISRPPTPDGRGPAAVWAITRVGGTPYNWAVGLVEGPTHQALIWTNAPRPR